MTLQLYEEHLEDLRKSGLSNETIKEAGIYSANPDDVFTVKLSDKGVTH